MRTSPNAASRFPFLLLAVLAATATAFAGGAFAGPASGVPWRRDYRSALAEGQAAAKPVFVSVHAVWCGPCKQMQATTFADPRLANALRGRVVPLDVDADRAKALVRQLGVRAYPTQLLLRGDGAVLVRREGYATAETVLADIDAACAAVSPVVPASAAAPANEAPAAMRAIAQEPAAPAAPAVAPAAVLPAVPAPRPAPPPVRLALAGHCPVTMVRRGEMAAGDPAHEAIHGGRTYRFINAAAKTAFAADPAKYLPGCDGDCPVARAAGRQAAGQVEFPALFRKRVYFLADEASRRQFLADPERFVTDEAAR